MKKFPGMNSLRGKLSYLMTFVVLITVGSLTVQSASKFSAYILQTIEESSTLMAERTASELANLFENLINQGGVSVSKLSSVTSDSKNTGTDNVDQMLKNDPDLDAIGFFKVDKSSFQPIKISFQDSSNAETQTGVTRVKKDDAKQYMMKIAEEISKDPKAIRSGRFIRNSTNELGAPSFLIAIRFILPNESGRYGLLFIVGSMTRVQVSLPQSRYTSSYIVNPDGTVFSSTDEQAMRNKRPITNNALVKKALGRQAPSGFMSDFTGLEGKDKIGSFAQFPGRFSLHVIVERDRKAAFQVITKMYITSGLWGVFILLLAGMVSVISAGNITKNLQDLVFATRKIASGDFQVRVSTKSNDEVSELSTSVNNMAQKIQGLMSSEIEKARFEKELETARMVQSTFFPKTDIKASFLSVTGNYQPATECGGDLWGHFTVREGVELVFIADAMGHGAPAALVTAIAYATCQSVAGILKEKESIDTSPSTLLRRLNHIILDAVDGKISMTFFAAVFDFHQGTLTYANAGHNFPFIITSNRDDKRLGNAAKKSFDSSSSAAISLMLQGTPLGVARDAEFREKQIALSPGDKLFFFTDGLIENNLKGKDPIGRKELLQKVCELGTKNVEDIKSAVLKIGADTFGTENLQDDVTVVIAEINPSWSQASMPASGKDGMVSLNLPPLPSTG